jgi:hypothetical protein
VASAPVNESTRMAATIKANRRIRLKLRFRFSYVEAGACCAAIFCRPFLRWQMPEGTAPMFKQAAKNPGETVFWGG